MDGLLAERHPGCDGEQALYDPERHIPISAGSAPSGVIHRRSSGLQHRLFSGCGLDPARLSFLPGPPCRLHPSSQFNDDHLVRSGRSLPSFGPVSRASGFLHRFGEVGNQEKAKRI